MTLMQKHRRIWIVGASDHCAVGREQGDKLPKCVQYVVQCREYIRVIMFNIRDHRYLWGEAQEHSAILISFHHKRTTLTDVRIVAGIGKRSTHNIRGVVS